MLGWRSVAASVVLAAAFVWGCGGEAPGSLAGVSEQSGETVRGSGADPEGSARAATSSPPDSAGAVGLPGEGLVVWESNRTGDWRIWARNLDGSGLRRLSPDEPGMQHCCPHISPDGTRVAYLSTGVGQREYPSSDAVGRLHLIEASGRGDRVVVDRARTYFENRAVVWRDPSRLVYIRADGLTMELDLAGGKSRALVADAPERHGWLIDSTLAFATSGRPTFSVYLPQRKTVARRNQLGGCQPYFSHDGRWGFWVAGAGGPLNRIELASRAVSTILEKNDPRMPEGYGYAYFPMLSRDGRLFAYAASQNQHDHFRSDYEVFVAETDPDTLEVLGEAVRITSHPASDRFPDVFLEPLALGRLSGETPFAVRLEPEGESEVWDWDFGDGATGRGEVGEHLYQRAGRYRVSARRGETLLRGQVVVAEARPPRVLDVGLAGNGEEVVVRFDEPVRESGLEARLSSGRSIVAMRLGAGGRELGLRLDEPLRRPDRLVLSGLSDRAQRPNSLPTTTLEVQPPSWPSRREGLLFLWETADAANLIDDPMQQAERSFTPEAAGLGRLDGHWAMELGGGIFHVEQEEASPVRFGAQSTNSLSLEATVHPDGPQSPGSEIVSFSSRGRGRNFRLMQSGNILFFNLRAGGKNQEHMVELFEIPVGRPSHVVVAYTPGRLTAYLDGEPRLDTDSVQGDFFHWRSYPLVFGGRWGGGGDWSGSLEGIAIYDRALAAGEAAENALRYREKLANRPAVPVLELDARLLDKSRSPTLSEISPYREALVVFEYEIERVVRGDFQTGRIRVAHWSILDGTTLAINGRAEGRSYRLELQPFASQPQLESLFLADTLEPAPGVPLFYAPDPS